MNEPKFVKRPWSTALLVLALLVTTISFARSSSSDTTVVEEGSYVLHKFENPIGKETYRILQVGDELAVEMTFAFTDRGSHVPLKATYLANQEFDPKRFIISGRTSRQSRIDKEVEVGAGKIRLRDREKWSDLESSFPCFPIAGYAPVTMQMLLVRYWSQHAKPAELPSILGGRVRIMPRGRDTITVEGQSEVLDRYSVAGLIWGQETLWFDTGLHLVAAISTDAEFDHFEAVQEKFQSALGLFVSRAGADAMAVLAELSKAATGSRSESIALVGGTLIDGTGASPVEDAAVVIQNGRITAAGPRSSTLIPSGARVVEARGKTFLPGLWDMHAHVEQVEWGPIYLAAGVTTVRDCGNEFEFITSVRDAVAKGQGIGPRILAAGIVDGSGPMAIGVERVDTPEQAKEWTDRYHAAGFQQMKIYQSVKLEELKAVADEAHRLGMTVTGHVPNGLNAYQVVEAGQDQINHLSNILSVLAPPSAAESTKVARFETIAGIDLNSENVQKAIAFFKEHHTVIDPTIALNELYTFSTDKPPASVEPGADKVAPELAAQLLDVGPPSPIADLMERMFRKELDIIGALHKAGVTIVAGTDQAVPGHSLHREIELYVRAGFTPMEAIQSATIVPARVMGLEKELGTIEVGKRGDVIILDGNPLQDISNTRKVVKVIANGVIYDPAELWQSVGFKP